MTALDPAAKVKIPRANLSIPRLCFGLGPIGDMPESYGYRVDTERAYATVRAVFDSGIGFFDTSRNYGLGKSEERIGHVIRERGGLPEGVVISSKLDRDFETNRFDRARARRSFEDSLKALGVSRIHILHLHDPEWAASLDEIEGKDGALAELFRIKEEGLVDAVGLAAGRTDIMIPMLRNWDFDVVLNHNRYTLLNRHAEAMYKLAQERRIAILNAAPYASGVLAKGSASGARMVYQEATAEMLAPVKRVEEVCARHGIPMGAAALQFSMRDPLVASTMIGVSRPERIAETLEWAKHPIPEAAWTELMALPYERQDPEATRKYVLG